MQPLRKVLKFELPDDAKPVDWTAEAQTVGQTPEWLELECATCGGSGFVVIGKWERGGETYTETTMPCSDPNCPVVRRNQAARYEALISKAPLPAEYRAFEFDSWRSLAEHSPAALKGKWLGYGAALAFVRAAPDAFWFRLQEGYDLLGIEAQIANQDVKNSLVLSGEPGMGKTSLAACIVNALQSDRIPALYIRVSNMLDALREPMNDDQDYLYEFGRTEQQILATFSKAPVLVLDEFNLARASDYSRQRLEDIIRHRMANQLPTVMTTNLRDFDQFNDHWGYRVGHAVQGMAHWVVMSGPELRRRGGPVESV